MKNLPHRFPVDSSDRAGSACLVQLLGLSVGLTIGLYPLTKPARAAVIDPKPNLSEFVVATPETSPKKSVPRAKAETPLVTISQPPLEPVKTEPTNTLNPIAQRPESFALGTETDFAVRESEAPELLGESVEPMSTELSGELSGEATNAAASGLFEHPSNGEDRAPVSSVVTLAEPPDPPAIDSMGEPIAQTPELSTNAADLGPVSLVAQSPEIPETAESGELAEPLRDYQPLLEFQAVTILQNDEFSGRLRATGIYAISDQVLFGATVDLTTGEAFVDSREAGLSLNELYVAASPIRDLPNLRVIAGLMDLTSYFDRNSFAKDGATHFFNPVFQTNPALSATGITSRPGLLVNWSATDYLELKAAAFSSSRGLGDFGIDGFAGEIGFRFENLIVRGTYATARDAGENDGFREIFQLRRSDGSFGPLDSDREVAYGINAEYFIESLNLGIFGRYGWYENQDLGRSGSTFSLGVNGLDVFTAGDRLGLAYGQALSNSDLRTGAVPDVWELLYDAPILSWLRGGISLQSQNQLSDTFIGLRLRADW